MFTPQGYSFCSVDKALGYLNKLEEIGFDSETTGLDPLTKKILTTQYGDGQKQFVVDHSSVDIQLFKPLLESKLIIMQNAKFDLGFLYKHGIVPEEIYDTFLAERILTTGIPTARKGLDHLVYHYCNQTLDKTIRGNIHREGLSTRVIKYAGDDVKYLPEIKRKQMEKIQKWNLSRAVSLDNEYVKVLAYIEFCGMKLDTAKWAKKCAEDKEALKRIENELDKFIFDNPEMFPHLIDNQYDMFQTGFSTRINWNSSKQVIPFMQKLGIDTKIKDKKTGNFKDSIDKKVLSPQKDKHPIIPIYIRYSEAYKLVSTYGDNWYDYISKETGRIHTKYTQIMNTGRLSSGQAANKKKGIPQKPNMQNVPADDRTRSCFVADKGNVLIVSDYSGQEQVVLANKSLEPNLLEFYDTGKGDMHSFIASKIYPVTYDQIIEAKKKKDDKEPLSDQEKQFLVWRQYAKAAGFAINYGGVGLTIANNLSIPLEKGEEVYQAYFAAFPGLDEYFKKQRKKAVRDGFITFNNVSNRKCFVYGFEEHQALHKELYDDPTFWTQYKEEKSIDSDYFREYMKPKVREYFVKKGNIERDALNYPIQGTSADITKLAGVYMFRYLQKNNLLFQVLMPNVVHDEIHLECSANIAEDMAKVLKKSMEDAGDVFCKRVPLKADPCITPYWTH
jgi:DNA polymerase I-like protein with 3'-5' exonuclease and polymerase domains